MALDGTAALLRKSRMGLPLLPWFGVVLLGIFVGKRLVSMREPGELRSWQPRWAPVRWVAFAGRHTLFLYVAHQPVFLGLLYLVARGLRFSPP